MKLDTKRIEENMVSKLNEAGFECIPSKYTEDNDPTNLRDCYSLYKRERMGFSSIETTLVVVMGEDKRLTIIEADQIAYGSWEDLEPEEIKEWEEKINNICA